MTKQSFFKGLAGVSVGLGLLLLLQNFFPPIKEHQVFNWISWFFFIVFTLLVYIMADRAAKSPNLNVFSSVILGVIFIKMVFILFAVVIYKKVAAPESLWFLIPFFIIYLTFTIFEVYFISILGKTKPIKSNNSEVQSTDQ